MAHILYFSYLVDKLGRSQEDLALPAGVQDVRGLPGFLRARDRVWEQALADDKVQVLVNKQFSLPETKISDADVIAIVSASLG
jgi:molybdopterin synthase sulfur carrier subunit